MKAICAEDNKVSANLKMALKLTFRALNLFYHKQNVALATAIFHPTTEAACKSHLSQRTDFSLFLALFS